MEFSNFVPSVESFIIYGCVLLYTVIATVIIPGNTAEGAQLKDGSRITYKLNGLRVHFTSIFLFVIFSNTGLGLFDGAIVWRNFFKIGTVAMIFSILFATFLYIKAYVQKNKLNIHGNNNFFMNWFIGVELNPFIFGFEIKANSYRPAFILEHLFAVSALYEQYYKFNSISPSMMVFQFITFSYIFDCYYYEDGLILMYDIIEENFGFMLLMGDYFWMPICFSFQLLFLVDSSSIHSSYFYHILNILIFITGYTIFRGSNGQKRQFRRDPTKEIWGSKPKVVETDIKGKNLLISGYWGIARKINYLGDILIGISWSMTCGIPNSSNYFGYFYPFYLTILLFNRATRDDYACREKYGKRWEEYCSKVKYMIIPYIY
eukprot:gene168-4414_t